MKGLTPKQRDVLYFIATFIDKNRYSPSYREIMTHFSMTSPGAIYRLIHTLKRKGALESETNCSRSIKPVTKHPSEVSSKELEIPFIGNISAGYPIEMFVDTKNLSVPASLVQSPENTYVIRNRGDGFEDELIQDGDLLIVEARQQAETGETILCFSQPTRYNDQKILPRQRVCKAGKCS